MLLCAMCCVASVGDIDGMESRDICPACCCAILPIIAGRLNGDGVIVPRGLKKLKSMRILGVVNIAQGKGVLQDIRSLTQLRKLLVDGINNRNGKEFCSVIAGLSHLESLSVRSEKKHDLSVCLDGMSSPPKNLESLKLHGNMVKLPDWLKGLQNLVKLKLEDTRLTEHDDAVQVLGDLPKLSILRMLQDFFQGEELHFKSGAFKSLKVLELDICGCIHKGKGEFIGHVKSVKFDHGAVVKLEQLKVTAWMVMSGPEMGFFALESLPCIKRVCFGVVFRSGGSTREDLRKASSDSGTQEELLEQKRKDSFVEHIRAQLALNPRKPILKLKD